MKKIRISKHFYISRAVILVFIIGYFFKVIPYLSCLFIAAILHELSHLLMCVLLKEKVMEIHLLPYGLNLKTEFIKNPTNQIMISAAGPLMNLFLMCLASLLNRYFNGSLMNSFISANFVILIINLTIALPLDGGMILKSIFTFYFGYTISLKIMMKITKLIIALLFLFGLLLLIASKFNFSLIIIAAFLFSNLKKEDIYMLEIQNAIFSKSFCNRTLINIKLKGVMTNYSALNATKLLGYNYIYIFYVCDRNMQKTGEITQGQLIDGIIKYGHNITMGKLADCLINDDV